MMILAFYVAALFASQSAAFLVVPGFSSSVSPDIAKNSPVPAAVRCPQCPFYKNSDDNTAVTDKTDSVMLLALSTNADKLYVNDKEIFPAPETSNALKTQLVRRSDSLFSDLMPTGYVLETYKRKSFGRHGERLMFYFTPIQVADTPVAVDTLKIPVIRLANGDLKIIEHAITAVPPPPISWRQCGRDASCLKRLLVARITSLIKAAKARAAAYAHRLSSFKGCHGKAHGMSNRPGHMHHQHHNDNHHGNVNNHHGNAQGGRKPMHFAHSFAIALRSAIIPGLVGVVAAFLAVFVGLVLGRCFVTIWMWRRYRLARGSDRENVDEEQGEFTEKEGLMTDAEYLVKDENKMHGEIMLPVEKE
ncbi:hypothetical protein FQN57_006569 [Myotisia sp. PD_48]|nr:hypothetical protein FQN57_006569 [Myotisia sp. PD_48]